MSRLLVYLAMLLAFAGIANAESPRPSAHPAKELEQKKQDVKKREAELKKKMKSIQSELKSTKTDMIGLAGEMKSNENKLTNLELEIEKRKKEQLSIEVRLEEDRGTISNIILAMQRMNRVPPQALLARTSTPLKTAQSAMLLESMLPSIYERAAQLKADHDRLNQIIVELEEKENLVLATSSDLAKQEKKLKKLLKNRETLYSQTSRDYKRQTAEIKIISAQAKTLKDLMTKIEKKQEQVRKREQQEKANRASAQRASFTQKVPMPQAGKPQLPVAGLITTSYGHEDDIGAKSEGLKIKARSNALVVAPMGGIIEYAGPFRNYGNILLIKHKSNYMSLIAGLGEINAAVGQSVSVGEPIGKTRKNNGDVDGSSLYYELRHKGNPVNPSKKFAGIR